MRDKIRVGVIGARGAWTGRAHLPAIKALPEYDLVAVATSRPETAAEAAKKFGAKHAHHDYHELIANPEVDLITVSIKAPMHYEMTMAALNYGKPVFTEWPLGVNVQEAEEMSSLAKKKGLHTMVGLQARVSPGILHLKELIDEGYVGRPLSCSMTMFLTSGPRSSASVWGGDRRKGAGTLSIPGGHSLDALCFCLGGFAELSSYVRTQSPLWYLNDTNEEEAVDAPDNILVNGVLESGCLVSIHVASTLGPAPGWRMEIYGTAGSLGATSTLMVQYGDIQIRGARKKEEVDTYRYIGSANFNEIAIPERHQWVPSSVPSGWPYNIAQLYRQLSDGILHGKPVGPDFEHAFKHHRLLHSIETAAEQGGVHRIT